MRDVEVLETINVRGAHGQIYKIRVSPSGAGEGHLAAMKVPAGPDEPFAEEMEIAELLRRYEHPYILRFLGTGVDGDEPFILMDLYEEGDLEDVLRAHGPLPLREALDILTQVGEAVHFLHGLGIFHRDLKAENIVITNAREPKLMDFGTARVYPRGGGLQIPEREGRLAPEQVDRRRDAEMLGEVLYHAVSGTKLYDARLFALAQRRRVAPAASTRADAHLHPLLAAAIDTLVRRAVDPGRQRPYQGVRFFLADLRRLRTEAGRERRPRRTGHSAAAPGAETTPGFLARAEAKAWQATEREPENAAPWIHLGNVHLVAMRPHAAERAYAQALRRYPQHAAACLNRAYALALAGNWDQALQTAIAAGTSAAPELKAAVRARYVREAGHLVKDAAALYAKKDPSQPACRLCLGYAQDALGHSRPAERAYREALALDPEFAPAAEALTFLALREGDPKRALSHAMRAVRIGEERAEAWYALGLARTALAQPEEASLALSHAASLDPNHPYVHRALGQAWRAVGDPIHAEEECRRAVAIDPCWAEARLAWGDALAALGRRSEARAVYAQAVALNPECLDADGRPGLSFALEE